jgi:hypothetical protein
MDTYGPSIGIPELHWPEESYGTHEAGVASSEGGII